MLDADEIFALAMDQPAVKAAVKKRASQIAARARKEFGRAGLDATVRIRDHPLPTGRTSVDVVADFDDGVEGMDRRVGKILRRAGREGRSRG